MINSVSEEKIAALRRTALFGELNDVALQALAERAIEKRLGRDEVLFIAGEEARGLYVIMEGSVRAYRDTPDGREQVIHVEHTGATIAELPVFDDQPYPSTVAAEEVTRLLFIDKHDVKRLCLEHPQIALAALKLLAARLRRCATLVETLSLHEVDQRLARWLLLEAQAHGKTIGKGYELALHFTHQQIASRIGSVREVVSRALARLQKNGLLVITGRTIRIPDAKALRGFFEK
jgi:CRP/FNR family transcriptional regulator